MKRSYVIFAFPCIGILLMMFSRHILLQGSQHKMARIEQEWCECATTEASIEATTSDSRSDSKTITITVSDKTVPTADQVPEDEPVLLLSTFLLIVVPVRPDSFKVRNLIRNTWFSGYKNSRDALLRFLVGTKNLSTENLELLKGEQSEHGDIVFNDLVDSRKALTNKTMAMLKWSHKHVNFSYLMKCNDNTYVYVDLLVRELRRRPKTTGLYYGSIRIRGPVNVDHRSIWFDPHWNLAATYLPYAVGGGYILSWDLVSTLAHQASYLQWHPNEDTAVGTWLAPYNHERRSDNLFCVTGGTEKYKQNCPQFPLFHIFYSFPQRESRTSYFSRLHNEYMITKRTVT